MRVQNNDTLKYGETLQSSQGQN